VDNAQLLQQARQDKVPTGSIEPAAEVLGGLHVDRQIINFCY
jgi:hypothetical protein